MTQSDNIFSLRFDFKNHLSPVFLFVFELYKEDMFSKMLFIAFRMRYSEELEFIVLRMVSISDTFLVTSLPVKPIGKKSQNDYESLKIKISNSWHFGSFYSFQWLQHWLTEVIRSGCSYVRGWSSSRCPRSCWGDDCRTGNIERTK